MAEEPRTQVIPVIPDVKGGPFPDEPTGKSIRIMGPSGLFGVGGDDLAHLQTMDTTVEGNVAIFPSKLYGTPRREPLAKRLGRTKDSVVSRVTASRAAGLYRRVSDRVADTQLARSLFHGYHDYRGSDLMALAHVPQPEQYVPRDAQDAGAAWRLGYHSRHGVKREPGRIGLAWERTKTELGRADTHFGVQEGLRATGDLIFLGVQFGSMAITRGLEVLQERWERRQGSSAPTEASPVLEFDPRRFTARLGSVAILFPAIREATQKGKASVRQKLHAGLTRAANRFADPEPVDTKA